MEAVIPELKTLHSVQEKALLRGGPNYFGALLYTLVYNRLDCNDGRWFSAFSVIIIRLSGRVFKSSVFVTEPWKDISGVVGLHHAVSQAGFDEERRPVKIPHTDKGGQRRRTETS